MNLDALSRAGKMAEVISGLENALRNMKEPRCLISYGVDIMVRDYNPHSDEASDVVRINLDPDFYIPLLEAQLERLHKQLAAMPLSEV
jgi:hypothetical protein